MVTDPLHMAACLLRRHALPVIVAGLPGLVFAQSQAQPMFTRAIRLIVPFSPGGSTDILARTIAPRLQLALGQTVIVDNKPGAGGSIGSTEAAKAEPDDHTLLMGHIGTLAVNPALYPKLGYDPHKRFVPVAAVARVLNVLVINARSPARPPAGRVCRHGQGRAQPLELFIRRQRQRRACQF